MSAYDLWLDTGLEELEYDDHDNHEHPPLEDDEYEDDYDDLYKWGQVSREEASYEGTKRYHYSD